MFNQDMKLCSSVSVPGARDIDVINENEAAVGGETCLSILDIANDQISIKKTAKLPDDIYGISKSRDKLLVTFSNTDPACIKLIDQSGTEHWSLSSGQNEQALFVSPWYATTLDKISKNVKVTDRHTNTLTVVNGDTDDIITRHQAERKGPFGVTTDTAGHVYVCYWDSREVAVLSEDRKEETILLSKKDGLGEKPQAIVYDAANNHLVISYFMCNNIDGFKLAKFVVVKRIVVFSWSRHINCDSIPARVNFV